MLLLLLLGMITFFVLQAACPATRLEHLDLNKVLLGILNLFFSHVVIPQCDAVFRDVFFAQRLVAEICNARWTLNILDLTSSCIHRCATSMCFCDDQFLVCAECVQWALRR